MSGASTLLAVPETHAITLRLDDPWYDYDPNQPEREEAAADGAVEHVANDETEIEAKRRECREKDEADLRKRLVDPKSARGAYLGVAIKDNGLTHARFRVLSYHLDAADPDLSNSFTSRKTAAGELGMELPTYDSHIAALRNDGYIRTQEFRKANGTQSSSGIQFCLPPRVFFSSKPWTESARRWNKRSTVAVKRNRKSRPAVND